MNNANLAAALTLAAKNIAVFPCGAASKTPATAHGVRNATTDRSLIFQWWNTCADFNVAAATGAISGFIAVDIDGLDAEEELRKQEVQYGEPLPQTIETITPRGRHVLL